MFSAMTTRNRQIPNSKDGQTLRHICLAKQELELMFDSQPGFIMGVSVDRVVCRANRSLVDWGTQEKKQILGLSLEEVFQLGYLAGFPDFPQTLDLMWKEMLLTGAASSHDFYAQPSLHHPNLRFELTRPRARKSRDAVFNRVFAILVLGQSDNADQNFSSVRRQATIEERRRIGTNLHDGVLQTLGGSLYELEAFAQTTRTEGDENTGLTGIMRGLRNSMLDLREAVAAGDGPPPLDERLFGVRLDHFIQSCRQRVKAEIEVNISPQINELETSLQAGLFLLIQEGLSNAVQHSYATKIYCSLKINDDFLEISIGDNGVGFDFAEESTPEKLCGLTTMQERVLNTGGVIRVDSSPGEGCSVYARWSVQNLKFASRVEAPA